MKHLLLIIIVIGLGFTSCDGRRNHHESLNESIKEFKKKSAVQNTDYIPKTFHEVITDTIMSNGKHIRLKAYTDMKNSVVKTSKKQDNITLEKHYREVLTEVTLTNNDRVFFRQTIDKNLILKNDISKTALLKSSTCLGIWLDEFKSLGDDTVLITTYLEPETQEKAHYNIIIKPTGDFHIIPIPDART